MANPLSTLVIFAHPVFERARVAPGLLAAAEGAPDVEVRDLYELYPDFTIDVEAEQQALLRHERIVLQFPFYWYSAPAMMKQRSGRIVGVASMMGRSSSPNNIAYTSAKWGVVGLVKAAAQDLAHHGVTVNAVPGGSGTSATVSCSSGCGSLTASDGNRFSAHRAMPGTYSSLMRL